MNRVLATAAFAIAVSAHQQSFLQTEATALKEGTIIPAFTIKNCDCTAKGPIRRPESVNGLYTIKGEHAASYTDCEKKCNEDDDCTAIGFGIANDSTKFNQVYKCSLYDAWCPIDTECRYPIHYHDWTFYTYNL